jgi:predicted transcriptional regulator
MSQRQQQVLSIIDSFSEGVTRQTIAGALTLPINSISDAVTTLVNAGVIVEDGYVHGTNGRKRALLWRS